MFQSLARGSVMNVSRQLITSLWMYNTTLALS